MIDLSVLKRALLSCVVGVILICTTSDSGATDVVVIGDSMMKSVARALKKECTRRDMSVEVLTSIGSGLARLDLFDWHLKVSDLVAEHKPRIVFVMMGANDNQAMQTGGGTLPFGSAGWGLEYGRRAGKLMDILIEAGASDIIWIGLPCMREKGLDDDVKVISRIVDQQALARPSVEFLSTYKMFSKKGNYSAYIIQKSGMPLDVRSIDGIHLNSNGAELLAGTVTAKCFDK